MSKRFNPYDGTNGNGYQPNPLPDGVAISPPKHGSNARKPTDNTLLKTCQAHYQEFCNCKRLNVKDNK